MGGERWPILSDLRVWGLVGLLLLAANNHVLGQLEFESDPINYDTAPVHDRVHQLQQRMIEVRLS